MVQAAIAAKAKADDLVRKAEVRSEVRSESGLPEDSAADCATNVRERSIKSFHRPSDQQTGF